MTYQKLFQAQRTQPLQPVPALTRSPSVVSVKSQRQCQTSLHNFWALPHRPSGTIKQADFEPTQSTLKCDDCDALLKVMDDSVMEIDYEIQEHNCHNCGRTVCDTCAVVGGMKGRECLQCKTSSKWVGGIGWIQSNLV